VDADVTQEPGVHGSTDAPRVAVLGIGRMGAAMTQRLRHRGFPVTVYNRSAGPAREVADRVGASVAPTPAAATAWAGGGDGDSGPGVVLVSLADDDACHAVYLGPDGLVSGLVRGTVVADTSTIDPETVRALAAAVAEAGGSMLDSPVSGSVPAALSGGLTVMVGGPEDALDRARPVLAAIGRRVVPVGGSGSGAVVKLAVNAVVHALNQALSESIVLAENAGVDRSVFYDVIADSAAAAPFVGYKREAFEHPESTPVAFSLDLVAKDLRLILALAGRVGAPMPAAGAVASAADEAIRAGFGAADMSAVARFLRGG
jgi:3-hydroxyisobutyrate dehydrogenase-like beta-hydroxyacid dehydrogenase